MYLVIEEDGTVSKIAEITDFLKDEADNGLIYLVCIADANSPREYYKHEWHEVADLNDNPQ